MVLACKAGGHPAPRIKWRREDGGAIRQEEGGRLGFTSDRSSLRYDAFLLGQPTLSNSHSAQRSVDQAGGALL